MKVTTKIRLDLNEHPFAEGESLVGYAARHALVLGIPGSLRDVYAGINRTSFVQDGTVFHNFIDEEWIEMEFERIGPREPETVIDAHVIEFNRGGWAIEHTPECRDGILRLLDCQVHAAIMNAAEHWDVRPVDADGRYVISFALDTGEPEFTVLDDDDV